MLFRSTTERFVRDFLVTQLGCNETPLQVANAPLQQAILYPDFYCDGTPVDEVCLASIDENLADNFFNVFPNPAQDKLTIESDNGLIEQIIIRDLLGREVLRIASNQAAVSLDVSSLKTSNYLIEVLFSQGNKGTKQFMIR